MNNQNKFFDDLPIFQEHENELVEFESTWNLEKVSYKAIPIPTQTDPLPKMEHKAINSSEQKNSASQTEPFFNTSSTAVNEKKLAESLRALAVVMEAELKLGTTNVFKFRPN